MRDDEPHSTLSAARAPDRARASPRARLTVVHPPALDAATLELGPERRVVGRRPGAGAGGWPLEHPTVSRAHAALEWDARRAAHLLRDLGSHNGTHVDGARLRDARELTDGAVLRLGDVLLVYERDAALDVPDAAGVAPDALPGRAACLRPVRAALRAAAGDPAPALLVGETGTGKERLAAELHRLSGRRGDFVAVNCAALSPQLVESQLFGHARGAFTGATAAQPGLFRAAAGGTLFLDEIGELPPAQQPKLLRALEQREAHPVGATRAVALDARVVAATHRDLSRDEGAFRPDLYARLSLWELRVPPLRERRVDVLAWLARFAGAPLRLDADAAEALLLEPWRLNLRAVDRLARELARRGTEVTARALPAWLGRDANGIGGGGDDDHRAAATTAPPRRAPLPAPNRAEFEAAYAAHGGSVRALARLFGRDRRQIYRWVEAYGLERGGQPG